MVDLKPDCANCAALCCLALAIDKGEAFAFDKPAGVPCVHLQTDHRCKIHADLTVRGCAGCVEYSCEGAGQRVISALFSGQSWQEHPALVQPMIEAFQHMRQVHKFLALLNTAKALPLGPPQEQERQGLVAQLSPDEGWNLESLRAFARAGLAGEIKAFFTGLKSVAKAVRENGNGEHGNRL